MKIAIIDSGIHPDHPHVGGIAGGVAIASADHLDRLGHGTAVAAAIREKCPDAELYAVKVFDRRLSANIHVIIRALEWCATNRMDLVNLSLGTANPAHRAAFELALSNALLVVSAAELLPGSLPQAIGVAPDPDCPRDAYRYREAIFYASPYPRSIPGVPPEHNLHGASFAVANMTGFVARALAHTPPAAIRAELIARAACNP
jgi:Subtilase family